MGTFKNVARSIPSMKAGLFSFFRNYLGLLGRKDLTWLQKMVLDQKNRPHFEIIFSNTISAFSTHKEMDVRNRVEGGEQFPTFEVPKEIYINEFVEEIVNYNKYLMTPCYLNRERSNVERIFENFLEKDENVEWWFKNGVNKIEYFGVKYIFPANRIKSFYPDFIVKYKDGSIGVYETKSKGDDENFGGFNEKTKCKAEALFEWKKMTTRDGRNVKAGIVLVISESKIYFNEQKIYDIEKAVNNDLADWSVFN
jgi:type III restriction enzyme